MFSFLFFSPAITCLGSSREESGVKHFGGLSLVCLEFPVFPLGRVNSVGPAVLVCYVWVGALAHTVLFLFGRCRMRSENDNAMRLYIKKLPCEACRRIVRGVADELG